MTGVRDSGAVLDEVRRFVARFVAAPSPAALNAITLWAAHAHVVQKGETSARLALLSPEPGSGKSRVLEVLETLTPEPMMVLNASAPAIFRSVDAADPVPTLLFDEVDAVFGKRGKDDPNEDLRGMLNAGYRRGATIPRCVGPRHEVHKFQVFCAVALAGLGDLPDTLMSRSVIIRMRRRAPDEKIEPYRRRVHEEQGHRVRATLAAWCSTVDEAVGCAWPKMPDGITDRPADVWEPLLAIADAAGGHWPQTARNACVELCRVAENRDASLGVRLLADLRVIFGEAEKLSTDTILEKLTDLDEAPWADLKGKPLDPRGLARRLRQYAISSTKIDVGSGRKLQGYRREDLWDAWSRYLPASDPAGPEPVEPLEPASSEHLFGVPDEPSVPEPHGDAEPNAPAVTSKVPEVPHVPDSQPCERPTDVWRCSGRPA